MRRNHLLFQLLLFSCLHHLTVQISKSDLLPYGPTWNDDTLPSDIEDASSIEIPLNVGIAFYSTVYKSIFVNTNGMLSFLTEIPSFYNIQFPLNYPAIAVFYSDVDTRKSGTVYYRETNDGAILSELSDKIGEKFANARQRFAATSAFIVTWDDVGYFDKKSDKLNSYQVVVATNGEDSYVILLYPDNGIQWIRGEGKTPGLPDANAQAALLSGDNRMFSLHGSGTDHVRNLNKLSNVGRNGMWMFHVGTLDDADSNVRMPDGENDLAEFATCAQGAALCHSEAQCVDYETGFCCECRRGSFGNGHTCLVNDVPQRINGKVSGLVNGIDIEDVDLHSYVVTSDGRHYTAMSRIPQTVGFDLQQLPAIGEILGWLFAVPKGKGKNGFQLTGGILNTTINVDFPQTGHHVEVKQFFHGVDAFNYLRVTTDVRGTLPIIPAESELQMEDYHDDYNRVLPGMIRSQGSLAYKMDGNKVDTPFKVDQIVTFDECPHSPRDPETGSLKLHVARNFITYDTREEIVRYASTNKISTLGGDDPCKEGRQQCGPDSSCVVEGDTFRCVCNPGFEYFFEDDANGEKATCIDINECVTGKANCHVFAECFNQLGSFRCSCLPGYSGDGFHCKKTVSCDDLQCHADAECKPVGPSQVLECRCKEGFHGNGIHCEAVREGQDCSVQANICDPNAECAYVDSLTIHVCRCLAGYRGDGFVCHEEDEEEVSCNIDNRCHPQAQCLYNTVLGTYDCHCNAGYQGDGYACAATDVTCDQVNTCSIHAKCVYDNIEGAHVCVCEDGYEGDGHACKAIDECTAEDVGGDACDANARCQYDHSELRYRCVCNTGYHGSGIQCLPVDDREDSCKVVDNCAAEARCIYDAPSSSYRCQCNEGFYGDGLTCQRVALSCSVLNNCDVNADCVQDGGTQAFRCQCREGYIGDGLNCIKGRPCLDDSSVCDPNAQCTLVPQFGQHICQCVQGYVGDGLTCTEAPRFEGNFLVTSQGMSLVKTPIDRTQAEPGRPIVMQPLQTAVGVDADCSTGHIYWSDVSGKAIKRSHYNGSNTEVFIDVDIESPEGVAVDWINRNIFWTDSIKDNIQVARLESPNRERKILVETNLSNPRGIAVHPARGLLFWSDWDRDDPKIESSTMDGASRTTIVQSELQLPNSLTIDFERDELCWADAGTKRIECSNLQGHNRRTIVSALSYPFGLANSRQHFYWTDWESRKIEIANKIGGQRENPIEPPLGGTRKLYGLAVVPERCPRANTPCSTQNGGCRYLCLPNSYGGRTCACPDYTLEGDDPVCNEI